MGMWSYRALQHFWTKSTIPIPYRGRCHSPGRCASFDFLNKRFSKQEAYQCCQSKLHFPRDKPKKLSSCGKRKWEVCCLMIVNYITNSLKAMTVDRGQLETVKLQWIQFIKADTFQTHTTGVKGMISKDHVNKQVLKFFHARALLTSRPLQIWPQVWLTPAYFLQNHQHKDNKRRPIAPFR